MSDSKDGRVGSPKANAGQHSEEEILSQPRCWGDCLKELAKPGLVEEVWKPFSHAVEWLFVGCGSSYYAALSAAAAWKGITGQRARAIPASEVLLFPDLAMTRTEHTAAVVISRSGQTSEAVQAAQLLETRGVRTLAVTCVSQSALEQVSSKTLHLLPANEESTVMTRSFSSMLLALEYLASCIAGNGAVTTALKKLPGSAENLMQSAQPALREFVKARNFADYVCLGQGPFFGLACESALKITEMSVSHAQSFHTLEFRHGPKSVVGPDMLVIFLLSKSGYDLERDVLEEIKSLGTTTLTVTNEADRRTQDASDLVIELKMDVPEIAMLAPYVFGGQLLGLYTGLKKDLDPDKPRNLNRVVMLDKAATAEPSRR